MITEYNCEHCNCNTTSETGKFWVQIDEKRIEQNKEDKANYLNTMDGYNKRVRETEKNFKSLVINHNRLVHWYNFIDKWYFEISEYPWGVALKVNIKNGWSWNRIKNVVFEKPELEPKLYKFIECSICKHRKYID